MGEEGTSGWGMLENGENVGGVSLMGKKQEVVLGGLLVSVKLVGKRKASSLGTRKIICIPLTNMQF